MKRGRRFSFGRWKGVVYTAMLYASVTTYEGLSIIRGIELMSSVSYAAEDKRFIGTDKRVVRIEGGFDGSNIYDGERIGENHYSVSMKPDVPSDYNYPEHMFYWFYMRVVGAKGRTVTIDINNCEWMPNHWDNYKPVYSYSEDPNDLTDHKWDKISKVSRFGKTFRFTHNFGSDIAYVALRYPYTHTYLENYIKLIKANPFVSVNTLGRTKEGRNIYALEITEKSSQRSGKKGIWLLAKEHACEQDGGWVIEGIMKYLLSNDSKAISLRKNTIFVLIPISAPDAAYYGRTVNPFTGFDVSHRYSDDLVFKGRSPGMTEETRAIVEGIRNFVKRGNNIDLAATFHNPHGSEENIESWYINDNTVLRHREFNANYFKYLYRYTKNNKESSHHLKKFVFIGRCKTEYNSMVFSYEINQHAKGSYLGIDDLHEIGRAFAKGVFDYFKLAIL